MSDAARGQLEKEIERQQLDLQRFQQDAQAEITELQNEVQSDFARKVQPLIDQMAKEKGAAHGVQRRRRRVRVGGSWARPVRGDHQEARRREGWDGSEAVGVEHECKNAGMQMQKDTMPNGMQRLRGAFELPIACVMFAAAHFRRRHFLRFSHSCIAEHS